MQKIKPKLNVIMEGYRQRLETELTDAKTNIEKATARMVDAPGAMVSHHDTSKVETGWLIDGLNKRAQLIVDAIKTIAKITVDTRTREAKKVSAGLLITLREGKKETCYVIMPNGEGRKLVIEDQEVIFVNPSAPLATQLLGKEIGEVVELGKRELEVFDISKE